MTQVETKGRVVRWYRCPVSAEDLRELSRRSDWQGWLQTGGYLGCYAATATAAIYSWRHWPWWVTLLLILCHGFVASFTVNAMHELGHEAVFRTRWLNGLFLRIVSFLGWHNFYMFDQSHKRHHAFTLHPPDDLEVTLPVRGLPRSFWKDGLLNYGGFWWVLKNTLRIARGRFQGPWELTLYPEAQPAKRRCPIRWAWFLLLGHAALLAVSLWQRWWPVPLVITFGNFYAGLPQMLCNNTQHAGLKDNVPDFRACCRTIRLNPLLSFFYWHMEFHTEHHMYPSVPCYRLHRLHNLIKDDLPPTPRGLRAAWREILPILRREEAERRTAPDR